MLAILYFEVVTAAESYKAIYRYICTVVYHYALNDIKEPSVVSC